MVDTLIRTAAMAGGMATPAQARSGFLQCVPFARQVSGIDIRGNAWTWWDQAAGRYERGGQPKVGSVMSFKRTGRNPYGHVAMVSKIVSEREVLLTHANWSYRGGVERNVRAIDVSPNNDWTDVRVWYGPIGDVGLRSNPTNGFIYADKPEIDQPVQIALADRATAGTDSAKGAF